MIVNENDSSPHLQSVQSLFLLSNRHLEFRSAAVSSFRQTNRQHAVFQLGARAASVYAPTKRDGAAEMSIASLGT